MMARWDVQINMELEYHMAVEADDPTDAVGLAMKQMSEVTATKVLMTHDIQRGVQ